MRFFLVVFGLCLALNAHALTINFSGVITTATDGFYHFSVGDTFTGAVYIDETIPTAPLYQQFLGAIITVPGAPTISFPSFLMSIITISPTTIGAYGNPTQFRGGFTLHLANGVVTGGTVSLNDEELRNNGDFTGIIFPANQPSQSVPEHTNAFALLLLGAVAVVGLHFQMVRV